MPSVAKKNRGKLFFFEERARYKFLTETAFQMQGYKCPEIGRVSIEGKCASWVIPNKQVRPPPSRSAAAPSAV